MPYKSEAQRKYFNANREKLEAEGVDVDEWNDSSKGKKLPEKAEKKAYGVSDDNYEQDRHLSAMPGASREEMLAATRALMARAKTLDGNLKFTGSRYAELPDEYYDSAEALKRIEALEGDNPYFDEESPLFYQISRDDQAPLNWDALDKKANYSVVQNMAWIAAQEKKAAGNYLRNSLIGAGIGGVAGGIGDWINEDEDKPDDSLIDGILGGAAMGGLGGLGVTALRDLSGPSRAFGASIPVEL